MVTNKEQSKNVVTLLMPSFSSENARALGGPETNIYLLEANKSALLSYASSYSECCQSICHRGCILCLHDSAR